MVGKDRFKHKSIALGPNQGRSIVEGSSSPARAASPPLTKRLRSLAVGSQAQDESCGHSTNGFDQCLHQKNSHLFNSQRAV